jgi:hypothetical protein
MASRHDLIPDTVETAVTVTAVLSDRAAMVTLPNGREVFAYVGSTGLPATPPLMPGAVLRARLFVADFSRAELLGS